MVDINERNNNNQLNGFIYIVCVLYSYYTKKNHAQRKSHYYKQDKSSKFRHHDKY